MENYQVGVVGHDNIPIAFLMHFRVAAMLKPGD